MIRSSKGYVYIHSPEHPRADRNHGYVKRADLVVEKAIRRFLHPGEQIHHRNHVKDDDRIENLELLTASAHAQLHGAERQAEARPRLSLRQAKRATQKAARDAKRLDRLNQRRIADGLEALSSLPGDVEWPSTEELKRIVAENGLRAVAARLGVSHVTVFFRLHGGKAAYEKQLRAKKAS